MKKVIITIIISILSVCGIGGFKIVNNQSKENSISNLPEVQIQNTTDENLINEEIVIPIEDEENKTSVIEESPSSEPEQEGSKEEKVIIPEKSETNKNISKPKTLNSAASDKNTTSPKQDVNNDKSTTESKDTAKSSDSDSVKSNNNSSATPSTPKTTSQTETKKDETSKEDKPKNETPVRCTNNHNHGMDVGNSGQWFSSKNDAIAYYNNQIAHWGNLWETDQIDDATYYKNCPKGYEIWSCMYCSKWTINFYYR